MSERPLQGSSPPCAKAELPATPQVAHYSPTLCYAFRLHPGQELKTALQEFTLAHKIEAGFIISCVGSVKNVSLRLAGAERPSSGSKPDPLADARHSVREGDEVENKKRRQERVQQEGQHEGDEGEGEAPIQNNAQEAEQHMLHAGPEARFEVLSVVGTLSPAGAHLHASLGDEHGAVCGGHLVRATVHTTAEIIVGVATSLRFSREMDPATGFKELVVSTGPNTAP